jgi:hypothetical protein
VFDAVSLARVAAGDIPVEETIPPICCSDELGEELPGAVVVEDSVVDAL